MPPDSGLRSLARDVVRSVRGHDLALYASGVTFYAVVGIIPLLLLSLYLAGLVAGEGTVRSLADGLAGLLPDQLGAQEAGRFLSRAGTGMSPFGALAAVVPASLYGEGLVRAFDRLSERDAGNRSLRGRIGSLVLFAMSPLLLLGGLVASGALVDRLGDGTGDRLLGVYLSFVVGWLSLSPLLAYLYRGLAPERPGTRALLWGAFGTGSFVAGTALGFVLFLSLGIDLGGAYGGVKPLANAVAAFGWLFVLHLLLLVGYCTTLCLDARDGHPLGPIRKADRVAEGSPSQSG